jgi:hypothetical protein
VAPFLLYWSAETKRPSHKDHDGSMSFDCYQTIAQRESPEFECDKLYLAIYCTQQASVKLGLSFGQDFFNKG